MSFDMIDGATVNIYEHKLLHTQPITRCVRDSTVQLFNVLWDVFSLFSLSVNVSVSNWRQKNTFQNLE